MQNFAFDYVPTVQLAMKHSLTLTPTAHKYESMNHVRSPWVGTMPRYSLEQDNHLQKIPTDPFYPFLSFHTLKMHLHC